MCLVSCPHFLHAVAILMLVLPNDWVECSQSSPPVSNDDSAAPRICVVCIRGFVALEHSIHVRFHATGFTNKLQMEVPLLTAPAFGIQHPGCEGHAVPDRHFLWKTPRFDQISMKTPYQHENPSNKKTH